MPPDARGAEASGKPSEVAMSQTPEDAIREWLGASSGPRVLTVAEGRVTGSAFPPVVHLGLHEHWLGLWLASSGDNRREAGGHSFSSRTLPRSNSARRRGFGSTGRSRTIRSASRSSSPSVKV